MTYKRKKYHKPKKNTQKRKKKRGGSILGNTANQIVGQSAKQAGRQIVENVAGNLTSYPYQQFPLPQPNIPQQTFSQQPLPQPNIPQQIFPQQPLPQPTIPKTKQYNVDPPPKYDDRKSEKEYKREIEQLVKSAIEDAKSDGIAPTVVQNQDSKMKKKVGELVEYEEKKHKKGLIAFPKHPGGEPMDFFKLINLQNPKDIAGELNKYEGGISLKYVSMRGKLLRELKKRVLNPDNYYYELGGLKSEYRDKTVIVSSRNLIILPKKTAEFKKYLSNISKKGKGYYLVVGHAEEQDGMTLVYRLPHRGFFDCDAKKIILMTKNNQVMEYDINDLHHIDLLV